MIENRYIFRSSSSSSSSAKNHMFGYPYHLNNLEETSSQNQSSFLQHYTQESSFSLLGIQEYQLLLGCRALPQLESYLPVADPHVIPPFPIYHRDGRTQPKEEHALCLLLPSYALCSTGFQQHHKYVLDEELVLHELLHIHCINHIHSPKGNEQF